MRASVCALICYIFNLCRWILHSLAEMGASQSIPIYGEIVTAIDWAVTLSCSGALGVAGKIAGNEGLKNDAWKLYGDAGKTLVEYSERSIIVAAGRAAGHYGTGQREEAGRVWRKMGRSVEEVVDNIPLIGHAKGVGHYIAGDTEHSYNCMRASSRLLFVACAGPLSVGLGFGVGVGAALGLLGGFTFDTLISLAEKRPYGMSKLTGKVSKALQERDAYESVRSLQKLTYAASCDALAGAYATETVELLKAKKQKSALKNKVGKEATQDLLDTAKELDTLTEDINGDGHVCTKAKNLDTGKAEYGVNERCRQGLRMNEFKKKGEASGYKSIRNAKKGNPGEFPESSGVLEKAAKQHNIEVNPIGKRSPQACAEHHAFNKLGTHGGESNVSASSVMKTGDGYKAVGRCGNCQQYGKLMGKVPSDQIHGMSVPVREFSFRPVFKSAAAGVRSGAKHLPEKGTIKISVQAVIIINYSE